MSTSTTPTSNVEPGGAAPAGFEGDRTDDSLGGVVRGYLNRIRGGDLGALPAVLGIVALTLLFYALRPNTFLTPLNLTNLLVQAAPITLLAMGLVFVLLLGDIDLSAGVVSGVCAAVCAQLLADAGSPWYVAVLGALVTGAVIGLFTGTVVSLIGIPSFVVTLALFLGFQGVTLRLIGQGGTVPIRDETVRAITNSNLPVGLGWALTAVAIVLYALLQLNRWRLANARGLSNQPLVVVVARIVVIGAVLVGITAVLSVDRALSAAVDLKGIPYAVPLVVVLLLALTFLAGRTTFGRHVYAVGGNTEAARRAGINVTKIRVLVFVLSSSMAAVSGLVAASRLSSVTPGSGGGNTLLYAVGAAVIGGTSLFGGRGRVRDAVLGGLVVAIIANGLGLLGVDAYLNFIITGAVLLLAASVDALARRRAAATGH
ncbi:sugar ABC transporter permease [Modestobacter versicolor]|uniref:Xylose transport system permease protein XylH n=1 Tax=Modestobacter versicolor TaxID=429133 RepID=A0A323V9C4_9ACTN|nr:ABC transporter permease [Modestobacter versicolor]MBB3674522.1 D-xylose transport system permease protein [Modestobacter versicolor]PZA21447.1 ABC transporter permease [Modestobacter versicolor]